MKNCFFCTLDKHKIWFEGQLSFILIDHFPVTKHHSLVIPKRHIASFFDLTDEELIEIKLLLHQRKEEIQKQDPNVTGFNIGINDGLAAGQSIFHLHVHLIPRRLGDIKNPRGGVRGVIPKKRSY